MMTLKWIHNNVVITGPHAFYLSILNPSYYWSTKSEQIQLIAPNIHKSTDSVTVKVTVAVDVSYANSNDQDPFIGISDGKSSIGFNAADTYTHPCHIMQENSENTIINSY